MLLPFITEFTALDLTLELSVLISLLDKPLVPAVSRNIKILIFKPSIMCDYEPGNFHVNECLG
jgi:hypothetical protein